MNLPSKKILQLALVLGIIGLFTYFFVYKTKKEVYTAPLTVQKSEESPLLAKDSDSDGLKDWEEQLWKTDPLNPDTDGDGTPDGAEIKSGRNPLVAGPNDKLDL
ncbi:MAG: hypothetical protein NUV54_03715, partial [Candidatus Taylorbacteria bacterium]|nr:hypothetical protein [Candidatus Taylorbacteria bacterium]